MNKIDNDFEEAKPLIEVKVVDTTAGFLKYIKFGTNLYKGSKYFVPPIVMDELNTFNPQKNPAYDFCKSISFLAYKDGEIAGRVTGVINEEVNKKTGRQVARFGWVDFIDDYAVSTALFDSVENWASQNEMSEIVGPLGFTDLDPEGCLIEGFEEVGTMVAIYNYPYYKTHFERLGYTKETDWVEFKMPVPDKLSDKTIRIAKIVKEKFNIRLAKISNKRELVKRYGNELFELINLAYNNLYGYSPLTKRQIKYYIKAYLGFVNIDEIPLVLNEKDELVGVGIAMPSLSRALQKSRGKLFPLGWIHLLKALKCQNDVADLLLVAVRPDYQNKGVNALFFEQMLSAFLKGGYKWVESNPELETNNKVQQQWADYNPIQHKRRRAFKKDIY